MANDGTNNAVDSSVAPMVVPASGSWDGNDGPWSTFNIHVGTPPQLIRVLISPVTSSTLVILNNSTSDGCLAGSPPNCPDLRGGLMDVNSSSTWNDSGIHALDFDTNLPNYDGQFEISDFGSDTLGLGLPGSNGPNFESQQIATIATSDFYLGFLGVNNASNYFLTGNGANISFLSSLKRSYNLPSISYGYSAGARYRQNSTASLTLGGYDASKYVPSRAGAFDMAPLNTNSLVVNLTSIYLNGAVSKNLLSEVISIFIDSTVPHLWLPPETCTFFEDAFGISYNSTVNRYLVDDELHRKLEATNVSVSFIINQTNTAGVPVNITLPYSSFDLETGPPVVSPAQRYFPLRKAVNGSQYTLGRTFLQEAYLIVDYERGNFTISPVAWDGNAKPNIVRIDSLDEKTPNSKIGSTIDYNRNRMELGTTVGAFLLFPITVGLILCLLRRIRKKRQTKGQEYSKNKNEESTWRKPEMDSNCRALAELDNSSSPADLDGRMQVELEGMNASELQENAVGPELEGPLCGVEVSGDNGASELKGDDTSSK